MNKFYGYIVSSLILLAGFVFSFLKGRSSGVDSKQQEVDQHNAKEQTDTAKVRQEVSKAISESKEQTNAQTRNDLIDSLVSDSVRKPKDPS